MFREKKNKQTWGRLRLICTRKRKSTERKNKPEKRGHFFLVSFFFFEIYSLVAKGSERGGSESYTAIRNFLGPLQEEGTVG